MLIPGTVLQNRYRIVRQLGQGGMGAVYEAVDQRLDTVVALKETPFADEKLRRQFEREARLLARLHHPALPRVSDHFPEGDGAFLVMQYIPGDDLAAMFASRSGPFPPEQVLEWADQLLDALDYLHTQDPQIIHRDIKPQNLKLTSRGQIVLLDFGLAKGQVGELSRVTATASIFGYTPNYAPLEQVQGMGTDPRSDLYALAATLYHLLTGVKPPDALTRAAAIVNGQPDPLRLANNVAPIVDPAVAQVLHRAMSQNREQRFATAAEMRRKLLREPETVTATNRGEAKTVLFPAAAAPTVSAAPVTAAPPAQVTSVQENAATMAQEPVADRTGETTMVRSRPAPKRRTVPLVAAGAAVVAAGLGGFYVYQRHNSGPAVSPPASSATAPAESTAPTAPENNTNASDAHATAPVNSKTEIPNRVVAKKEPEKKPEKTDKSKPPNTTANSNAARAGDHPPTVPTPAKPPGAEMPGDHGSDTGDNGNPNGRRRQQQQQQVPGTRVMPNGTKVTTTPNGTRIVVFPDGTTRVFNPDQPRRKRPNK
jgi:eukaryotic-like serine/threonine-protein kinase